MSKLVALLILFPMMLIETVLTCLVIGFGMRGVSLITFISWLLLMGPIIGLTFYILFFNRLAGQNQGYMEVSNYNNLNRLNKP